jgi:hypothetical protein
MRTEEIILLPLKRLIYSSTLNLEASDSCEITVTHHQTTWSHIMKDKAVGTQNLTQVYESCTEDGSHGELQVDSWMKNEIKKEGNKQEERDN